MLASLTCQAAGRAVIEPELRPSDVVVTVPTSRPAQASRYPQRAAKKSQHPSARPLVRRKSILAVSSARELVQGVVPSPTRIASCAPIAKRAPSLADAFARGNAPSSSAIPSEAEWETRPVGG